MGPPESRLVPPPGLPPNRFPTASRDVRPRSPDWRSREDPRSVHDPSTLRTSGYAWRHLSSDRVRGHSLHPVVLVWQEVTLIMFQRPSLDCISDSGQLRDCEHHVKLVLYLASVPPDELLEEASRIPGRLGLRTVEESPPVQTVLPPSGSGTPGVRSWDASFAGSLSLHTYFRPDCYSRGAVPTPTLSLQSDSHYFRLRDPNAETTGWGEDVAAANYALFIELAKAYYGVLRPVVGITFDEDHEPVVLYWEDATACRLAKLYNLTLLSSRFKNISDPAVADGLEVHRTERLVDGGLLISLCDYPLRDDSAVRIQAEVEIGFHPEVDPAEFRWRVARFDQALQDDPEGVARDLGLGPEDIERGRAASVAAGLPAFSFLNVFRRQVVERALSQSHKPRRRRTEAPREDGKRA